MTIRFRLLTEPDVKAVLTMDDLIETMASALERFSSAQVVQPVRPTIAIAEDAFFATMPAYVRSASLSREGSASLSGERHASGAALGAKLCLLHKKHGLLVDDAQCGDVHVRQSALLCAPSVADDFPPALDGRARDSKPIHRAAFPADDHLAHGDASDLRELSLFFRMRQVK